MILLMGPRKKYEPRLVDGLGNDQRDVAVYTYINSLLIADVVCCG